MAKPRLQTPPTPTAPAPAALCLPGGWAFANPSELEAVGRPLSGRLRSGAKGLVSSCARQTALPAEGPSKVWGEGTGGTQDASCLEAPRGAFPLLRLRGRGRRRAGCTQRCRHAPPRRTLQSFSPRVLPAAARGPDAGEASGLRCSSGKWWGLRRAQESARQSLP